MHDEEIERVLNYLARQCPANLKPDFSLEEQLALTIKRIAEVTELNRQTSKLIRETRKEAG